MSPRLLFLTPDLPYPPHQGAALRTFNLIRNLTPRHVISLLSFADGPDVSERVEALAQYCAEIVTVSPPHRSAIQRSLSVLFSPLPDMAHRLPSTEYSNQLRIMLNRERFDVVQVEAIEMAQYGLAIAKGSPGVASRVIFDDINAEYLLQRRAFEADVKQPSRWLGALYSLIQWRKLQVYEARVCRQVDQVVVVSQADGEALQNLVPGLQCAVVPNGVDSDYFQPVDPLCESDLELVFTGKMDFRPNVDAILWFVEDILPLIHEQLPDTSLTVVGRDPHRRLTVVRDLPRVRLTGQVDDVRPYIARASVFVVPLKVGGGTRLKLLQAMSMGKAIVATSLACEGISVQHGRHLLIADDPAGFARAVVDLIKDPSRRRKLGRAARSQACSQHDWKHITPLLEKAYEG